jgi:DNA (cytosine-5)-methyltransferase 1
MKIGSLCTGYGGLDMAVEAYFNAETIWCAEHDKYASQLIKKRFNIPNYGDIKAINWAQLEPIDILTAGYPCQPFSHAGYRKGTEDERHIFPYILEAISILRPSYVILENVRGHLSLGLKEVLAGLTKIGYDARWQLVRASDVGAPHQRARIFIIAYPTSQGLQRDRWQERGIRSETNKYSRNKDFGNSNDSRLGKVNEVQEEFLTQSSRICKIASNANDQYIAHDRQVQELGSRFTARCDMHLQTVPNPLDEDEKLSAFFVEYMMGLPTGWVTDTGLSRAQQLKMLGNGVVPQQAYYALEVLLGKDTPC